jgi:hypothetical protein
MKKLMLVTFLLVQLVACKKVNPIIDEPTDVNVVPSKCIALKVEKFVKEDRVPNFSGVTQYEYKSKAYFYFDYGTAADAPAYLLSNNCDTVCTFGFKKPQNCQISDFFEKAVKIKDLVK